MTFLARLFLLHGNRLTSSGNGPLRSAGPSEDCGEILSSSLFVFILMEKYIFD